MIKIFDPYQMLNLSNDLNDFNLPKQMYDLLIEEWPIYKNICSQLKPIEYDFCLEKWWISHRSRLPNFFEQARWILRAPCSSTDSERAFSKYNLILSDSRQNMSEETIKMHNFFYFNFRQHLFINEDEEELDEIIPLSD
ncbi:unnamed protein product [Brachionus calyciflorus]|uniref:HAT C-terminal dimerisation domain-containing protein n=1 Tax=Brachionus calyciflorus TaxID=104777 RepID=A0A814CTY4_9BILA|nr:unnamed protein product [Brachionus calyciflorus]